MVNFLLASFPFLSQKLAEASQLTTPPGWFTSSLAVGMWPPYLSSSTSFLQCITFFPALPKVHSDAEGGPLNLPQSLVIMFSMLDFLILFMQQ